MHEYSKKILDDFLVRKSYAQKTRFLDYVTKMLDERNILYSIEEGGKILKSRNLVVGDLKNAKTILTAHYDTQACLPIPNLITPLSWTGIILYNIFILLFILVTSIIIGEIASLIAGEYLAGITIFLVYFMIFYMFFGKANKHTANDNTSGVILLLELILNIDNFDDICIVFFDLEEVGMIGSSRFKSLHKLELKSDMILFNFDCISDGDAFYFKVPTSFKLEHLQEVFTSTDTKEAIITYKGYYPSDQINFGFGIACASLKKKWNTYYIDRIHTSKDTIFKEENIIWYKEKVLEYIDKKRECTKNV